MAPASGSAPASPSGWATPRPERLGAATEFAIVAVRRSQAGADLVQRERELAVRAIQALEWAFQDWALKPAMAGTTVSPPGPARPVVATPLLRDLPARTTAQRIGRPPRATAEPRAASTGLRARGR